MHGEFKQQPRFQYQHQQQLGTSFPKIYMLQLPPRFNQEILEIGWKKNLFYMRSKENTVPFGPLALKGLGKRNEQDPEYLFDTGQFELDLAFHERLSISSARVFEPLQADYLYIPFFAGAFCIAPDKNRSIVEELFPKSVENSSIHPSGIPFKFLPKSLHAVKDLPPFLIMHPSIVNKCPGLKPPISQRPFARRTVWLSQPRTFDPNVHENTVILHIPYPTSVHLPERNYPMPWSNKNRSTLAVFKGNDFMNSNRKLLRNLFQNSTRCHWTHATRLRKASQTSILDNYLHTVFCPLLAGDTWLRKAFVDSLTVGCIPVLFWGEGGNHHEMGNNGPFAFFPFANYLDWFNMTVSVSVTEALVEGKLEQLLEEIPQSRIDQLQANIAVNARKLQYSGFDDEQDAFSMTLRMLRDVKLKSRCSVYNTSVSIAKCFPQTFSMPLESETMPTPGTIPFFDRWKESMRRVPEYQE